MYIVNGICYAGEPAEGITISDANPLDGGIVLVTFSTGEKRLFDTTRLKGSVFAPLSDARVFRNPVISHGTVTWDNEQIDIAPEYIYQESYPYSEAF
ncbi:MAG: DUF2442 domain-containing protein [Synergistaceae bacterium]|nr:DUF2442 domain-containing protein [Synergistaceae bacterium]